MFNSDINPLDRLVNAVVFTKSTNVALRLGDTPVDCILISQQALEGGQRVIVTAEGEKLEPVDKYYRSEIVFHARGINGLGYQTYFIEEESACPSLITCRRPVIENDRYRISLNKGALTLENIRTRQRLDDFLAFVDCGDNGDEFDFAPLDAEKPLISRSFTLLSCEVSPLVSRMTLESTLELPQGITQRLAGTLSLTMTIRTTLELRQHDAYLRVRHHLVNQADDHRLRVYIKTPVNNPTYSWADQGYSLVRRENISPYVEEWRQQGFVEKPMPIYTLENGVALRNDHHVFYAMTQGIKEYEVIPQENTLALTLFRSVGLLGKDDTAWRPGRASGINNKVVKTPDAQMHQEMIFDYALMIDSKADDATFFAACHHYREHYLTYQLQQLNTFEERLERFAIPLPEKGFASADAWLSLDNPRVMLSMCKPGADGSECIIRLFNPTETPQNVVLSSKHLLQLATMTLEEEVREPISAPVVIAARDYLTLAVNIIA